MIVELLTYMPRQELVTPSVDMQMIANAMCHNIALSTPMQLIAAVSFIRSFSGELLRVN
jgi:hypothetical protein